MIQKERLQVIMQTLEERQALSLKEIIQLTGASRDTARRDIVKLADRNLIQRTYGGIALPQSFKQLDDYLQRSSEGNSEKQQLAQIAGKMVHDAKSIYLDVSTTISYIPQYLENSTQLFTVTNSIDIADQLLRNSECETRMLGGNLDREKRCVIGTRPLIEMEQYQFDLAFVSVVGLDSEGVYYAYEEDIDMKNKLRKQTAKLVLLADTRKINQAHYFKAYNWDQVDTLVTNKSLPNGLAEILEEQHVTVLYAGGKMHD
ncbi:DeoR/GlpR family DNA-binding transcription regulator [Enterococcus sp. AZ072]|uniref:DeoR/GlpR family DNA-binding transcription regulator n=1 Tax=unclassified Enterococcus TaxID=2608891 RepID=UPI003D26761C